MTPNMLERFLFIFAGLFAGLLLAQSPYLGAEPRDAHIPTQPTPPQKTTEISIDSPTPKPTEQSTKPVSSESVPKNDATSVRVISVHDGDTITVLKDGVQTKVRLIGINAPEIYNYQKAAQCFGTESTTHAKELLLNQSVRIETDPSQDTYDKYGRLLAYVFLPNGTNFAEQMIREGYAYEYTYRLPYQYQKEFKLAQQSAQKEETGLWKSGVCAP
jgi:micrococcal nuclease